MLFNSSHHKTLVRLCVEAKESPSLDAKLEQVGQIPARNNIPAAGRGGRTRPSAVLSLPFCSLTRVGARMLSSQPIPKLPSSIHSAFCPPQPTAAGTPREC